MQNNLSVTVNIYNQVLEELFLRPYLWHRAIPEMLSTEQFPQWFILKKRKIHSSCLIATDSQSPHSPQTRFLFSWSPTQTLFDPEHNVTVTGRLYLKERLGTSGARGYRKVQKKKRYRIETKSNENTITAILYRDVGEGWRFVARWAIVVVVLYIRLGQPI